MNTKIIGGIIVVVIIGGAVFFLSKGNSQPTNTPSQTQTNPTTGSAAVTKNAVAIQNMAFSNTSLTVKVGDTVTWTNQDSIGHSATADDNSFDTGVISQGQSVTATFSKAGTFTYHCKVHPTMTGTIIVQ